MLALFRECRTEAYLNTVQSCNDIGSQHQRHVSHLLRIRVKESSRTNYDISDVYKTNLSLFCQNLKVCLRKVHSAVYYMSRIK